MRQNPVGKSYRRQDEVEKGKERKRKIKCEFKEIKEHEENELERVHIHHQQISIVANTVTPGPNIGAAPHS